MPRAPKVCSAVECSALAVAGASYCAQHQPKPWASSTRRSELPRSWNRIRRRILRRDPLCTLRYPGCEDFSTEVHHVGDPMDHSDQNLAGTCHACHSHETQQQAARGRAAMYARPTLDQL